MLPHGAQSIPNTYPTRHLWLFYISDKHPQEGHVRAGSTRRLNTPLPNMPLLTVGSTARLGANGPPMHGLTCIRSPAPPAAGVGISCN